MNDINIIYTVLESVVKENKLCEAEEFPPIFSFEGLPGAGKTTQIKRGAKIFKEKYGKSYYIDLPTDSSVGLLLKALYSNQDIWNRICFEKPWLNPLLLSIDLQLALKKAKEEDAKYVLMSRGILSTYYYNYEAYMKKYNNFDNAWNELTTVLKGFIRPKAIIFFEIDEVEANKRVVKRNRGPLRKMDEIEIMKKDRKLFDKYLNRIEENIPVHYINASGDEEEVTTQIEKVISKYLEVLDE